MQVLNQDIKEHTFKPVYLLFGEEVFLRNTYKKRLREAVVGEDVMNFARFEGKGLNVDELIRLADTMPFFAERRLIVFENSGLFKSGGTDLADYIKELPESTSFVFVENEVDKRSKLYKSVKARGRAVELGFQDENTLKRWVAGLIRNENRQAGEQTIAYFLNKAGTDMENITKELEKLFCYTFGRDTITKEDVDAVCVAQITNHIFEMVDAVAQKKQKKALELYYDLLALKEPPMRILFLMIRQYRILLQVKGLLKAGYGRKEVASKAGLHPFVAGKYMDLAKRFPSGELRAIMEEGADLEQSVKTGRLTDHLAVELFLVKYSL